MYLLINTSLRRSELESVMSVLNDFDSNALFTIYTFNTENYFKISFWTSAQNFFNCLTEVYVLQCIMPVKLFF